MRSIEHLGFFNDFLLAPNNERPHTPKRSRIPSPPRKPTAHSNHKNQPLTPTTKTDRSLQPQKPTAHSDHKTNRSLRPQNHTKHCALLYARTVQQRRWRSVHILFRRPLRILVRFGEQGASALGWVKKTWFHPKMRIIRDICVALPAQSYSL